jgi:MYXO-CTERM domain-containing protein
MRFRNPTRTQKENLVKTYAVAIAAAFAALISSAAGAVTYTPFYSQRIGYQDGGSTIVFGKDPAVYISETASSNTSVNGTISYSFLINGGPANSFVPMDFLGNFSLVFQGDLPGYGQGRWSQAQFSIEASDSVYLGANYLERGAALVMDASCNMQSDGGCSTTSLGMLPVGNYIDTGESFISSSYYSRGAASLSGIFSGVLYAPTDALGQSSGTVTLFAAAGSGSPSGTGNFPASTTFLDPHFEINANWLASHPETTLALPPGVGNATVPVPEPAPWALALLGLAVLATRRIASRSAC